MALFESYERRINNIDQLACNFNLPLHLWRYNPWRPSDDASILLYLLLVFSILLFLGSVMCPSGRRHPILFLVFPLVLCNLIPKLLVRHRHLEQ
jgi:hypothetical protein